MARALAGARFGFLLIIASRFLAHRRVGDSFVSLGEGVPGGLYVKPILGILDQPLEQFQILEWK